MISSPSNCATPPAGALCLVTGLTGQDGYYLAKRLMAAGCRVAAAVRPGEDAAALADELRGFAPGAELTLHVLDLPDEKNVDALIASLRPDVIYHLAAQSHVGTAWEQPAMTLQTNAAGTLYMLEAVRKHAPGAAFIFAGSCDCFDHEAARAAGGLTPSAPYQSTNPYSASKVYAMQMLDCWRAQYKLRAATAILYNHTSPRRPERFIERGIVKQAVAVARGKADAIVVGALDTTRDWSWAEDLIEAFAAMGAMEKPEDLVLSSGVARTIGDWVNAACRQLGLDPERCVKLDPSRCHKGDRPHAAGNISRAKEVLGWAPRTSFDEIVARLIAEETAE